MATYVLWFENGGPVKQDLPAENTRHALGMYQETLYDLDELQAAGGSTTTTSSIGYDDGYKAGYSAARTKYSAEPARSQNLVPEQRIYEVENERDEAYCEIEDLKGRVHDLEQCLRDSRDEAEYVQENIDAIQSNFADLKDVLHAVSL